MLLSSTISVFSQGKQMYEQFYQNERVHPSLSAFDRKSCGVHEMNLPGRHKVGYSMSFSLFIALLIGMSCSLQGCAEHEEDEDHHLEHLIPEHKPVNYADAITQLDERGAKYFETEMTESDKTELIDIVDWLPEIAADSDLNRQQWEAVQKATPELRQIIVNQKGDNSQKEWESLVDHLGKLIKDSDVWHSTAAHSGMTPEPTNEENSDYNSEDQDD